MKKTLISAAAGGLCLLLAGSASSADLSADAVVADGLGANAIMPDAGTPGSVSMPDGAALNGALSVGAGAAFPDGVSYLSPLGDVPMGCYTNTGGGAPGPAWWVSRGVTGTNAACDFAAAAQGQVKWIAVQAAAEFQFRLAAYGGMGAAVSNLVSSLSPSNNSLPVVLGQLKNAARPFYDRLAEIGAVTNCPWSGQASDCALANVGQVKFLFSFDFGLDSDCDGMPDWWEAANGFDRNSAADASVDSDGDTVNNLMEYLRRTNPRDASSANITLYADSDAGSDAYDGLYPAFVSGTNGPSATVQKDIGSAVSGDTIELRGAAAFADRTLSPGNKSLTLSPRGSVRF